ncbi:MAG: GTPase HflX [Candidatus Bathyarchaeota archaeon]|nr:GTPase HflX [Candidatus Bathyarchaeota archaeon]
MSGVKGTRAIIVQRRKRDERSSLSELKSLAESAGYVVIGSVEQVRGPDPGYQIGVGKAAELARLVRDLRADRLIFDNSLKPIQSYNLAKVAGVEAIDRFQLILEVFAKKASTKEAKFQIQLAKFRYQLPRARESVRLATMGEQPGFLGMGRYKVDVYYESIKKQITQIRGKLKRIRRKRGLHRVRRLDLGFSLVSLAGYTNSGKSTLFNALTEEGVPTSLSLFTTLSTTTRAVSLNGRRALITDTVGFIDRLPLALVESFHSTLEETILSDVIVLVVDASETISEVQRKTSCCFDTLREIKAVGIPVVTALNKIDLLKKSELTERFSHLRGVAPNLVPISAFKGENLGELKREISKNLEGLEETSVVLPLDGETMSFVSGLYDVSNVVEVKYRSGKVKVRFRAQPKFMHRILGRVERLSGKVLRRGVRTVTL